MVTGSNANNGIGSRGQSPAEGAGSSRDAAKGAGENPGQGRDAGRGESGSKIIRQQLEQAAAQKFPGDRAGAANFMKEASKAMGRAEREGMVPKPQGRERPQEQEAARPRDSDRER